MGRLCREFERMRGQLAENNQQLWKMLEEEKALRAAIAHDIRSPLSVLEGGITDVYVAYPVVYRDVMFNYTFLSKYE